jgi:hypothetical protein
MVLPVVQAVVVQVQVQTLLGLVLHLRKLLIMAELVTEIVVVLVIFQVLTIHSVVALLEQLVHPLTPVDQHQTAEPD